MTSLVGLLRSLALPFQWWVTIAPWEQGVRVRLGKTSKILRPGIHLKVPWLDRVYVVSTRLRMISDQGTTMMSADSKPVNVKIAVQFCVANVQQLMESIANPEDTIITRVQVAVAAIIAKTNAIDLTPEVVQGAARISIPEDWGLARVDVNVTGLAIVRTYKLMMHEYRTLTGLDATLGADEERRRLQMSA